MPAFTLSVETTSNATAGGTGGNSALQFIMPSSRQAQLLWAMVHQETTAAGENSGTWVIDRISAVSGGTTLVPLQLDPFSRASDITSTTTTIASDLTAAPTVVATTGVAILTVLDGFNDFTNPNLYPGGVWSGANQGFALRRATAPTGARIVRVSYCWKE